MATTTNNGWETPDDTDLVKDGALAMRTLGNAIDTSAGKTWLAWTSYTPTLRQGTTIITTTVNYAKYVQIGKTVILEVRLTATSAGSAGNQISITPPSGLTPVIDNVFATLGTFVLLDSGTSIYSGYCANDGGVFKGLTNNTGAPIGQANPSMTIANNDIISLSVVYEVA